MSIRFFTGFYPVPPELEEQYLHERISYNAQQLKLGAIALIPLSLGLGIGSFVKGPGLLEPVLYGVLFLWSLFYALTQKIRGHNPDLQTAARRQFFWLLLIFVFLTALGVNALSRSGHIYFFMILQLYLSVLIWLTPLVFSALSVAGFVVFALISLVTPDFPGEKNTLLSLVLSFLGGWFLYLSLSSLLMENFYNRISLEAQYRQVATEAVSDPLTGLYNKKTLNEDLNKEWAKSERSSQPFSLILLNIDYFRDVNETYGHTAGDRLLKEMGELCRNMVRLSDKVYRYSAESFLIVLTETPRETACIIAERIRSSVESNRFTGIRKKVTVSLGTAQSDPEINREILVNRVVQNLQTAKEKGRNRVVCQSV